MNIAEQWGLPADFQPVRFDIQEDVKNVIRDELQAAGMPKDKILYELFYTGSSEEEAMLAFSFPGFVPAYIRPLFCQGKGPFRWAA